MRRAALLLVTLFVGWLVAGVVTAGPASAHATLLSTEPGEGARVATAPTKVTLTFSEGVSLGGGYARVLGAGATRVDTGAPFVRDNVVTIPLRSGLRDGGYLVTYRIVSADSHPVSGAFSFVVGQGRLVSTTAALGAGRTDPVVGAALPAARWIGFAGLALGIGVPALALVCWPAGWASNRLRRMATWGAVAVAVSAVASFLLQGPYVAAAGLGSVFDPALLDATVSTPVGWLMLVRVLLALELIVVLVPAWRRGTPPSTAAVVGAGVLAAGLVGATAGVGHPAAGPWPALALTVTFVHVAAMAVWLGGLAALLAVFLRPASPALDLATALPRFSRLAFGAVVALVVSGIVQAVREVETPTALFSTTYGWLLVAKVSIVLVILGAAGVSRVWVQQRLGMHRPRPGSRRVTVHAFAAQASSAEPEHRDEDDAAATRRRLQAEAAAEHVSALRRSVLVELALAGVVLVLSAVLVGTQPASAAVTQPVDRTLALQGAGGPRGSVQVSIDPGRPGPNALHIYLFDDAGQLTQPAGILVTLTEKQQDIGPIEVPLQPAGPGHYLGDGMDIPGAGTWTLTVTVRVDEFTATAAALDFPVR